jgi:amidohydrolase
MVENVVDLAQWVKDIHSEVINWRRHLHEYPELSFQEVETSKFVYETLNYLLHIIGEL